MVGAVQVLAVNNFGDTRTGGLAGPMGLFIILVLTVGTVLLIRSMNARLRRLPDSFPDPEADRSEAESARRTAETAKLDADLRLPDAAVDRPAAVPPRAPGRPGRAGSAKSNRAGSDTAGPPGSAGEPTDRV